MGLTTRPPGGVPGGGLPEPAAPVPRELRAIVDELRALIAAAGSASRALPPLPEPTGAAPEPALARWFRAALESGRWTAPALKALIEQAAARQGAGLAPAPDARALDAAREALLRLVANLMTEAAAGRGAGTPPPPNAPPPDPALALRVLAEEIRRAVVEALGTEPPWVAAPAAAEDPGNAGAALLGWLRAAAARAAVPLATLAPAIAAGAGRASALLGQAGSGAEISAALTAAREVIGRGLDAARAGEPPRAPQLLYRPDLPPRPPAGPVRGRGRDGGERVQPIGAEDHGAAGREPHAGGAGSPADGDDAEPTPGGAGTEGPMPCIRRCVDALYAGDAAAYGAEWVYPACFWIDGRWLACADEAALAALQARILRARRERGVVGGRILLLRVDPVSDSVALVHVLASEERADGGVAREVEALYTTLRTAAGWRVAVVVSK